MIDLIADNKRFRCHNNVRYSLSKNGYLIFIAVINLKLENF